MNKPTDIKKTLVDVNDSVLVVIDIQDSFLSKYDNAITQSMVGKVAWILQIACLLDVPIVAMAEDINHEGNLTQAIRDALPADTTIYSKDCFNLTDNPDILAAVEATGRKTAILVGMETDVCVAQSALGLMERDFQVLALKDGMATTAGDEDIGLSRMHGGGVVISSVKAVYYEWLRSVTNCDKLRKKTANSKTPKQPRSLLL